MCSFPAPDLRSVGPSSAPHRPSVASSAIVGAKFKPPSADTNVKVLKRQISAPSTKGNGTNYIICSSAAH
jgi:hypothetical protein